MIVLQDSSQPLKRVRLSPDGRTLATGSDRAGIRLWNLRATSQPKIVAGGRLFQCDITFTRDGTALLTGFYEAIRSTEVVSGREELVLRIPAAPMVWPAAIYADGRALFVRSRSHGRQVECWSWREEKLLWQSEDPLPHDPSAVAVSPNGQALATVTSPPALDTLTFSASLEHEAPAEDAGPRPASIDVWATPAGRVRHSVVAEGPVTAVAFSSDSQSLAWVSGTKVHVRDTDSWQVRAMLQGDLKFKSVAFDPSGRLLATAGNDGVVRFWDTETWAERVAFDWDLGPMWDVTFSADGLTAACCGMAGKVVVWDVDG
jgi:WD40 repeat protein